VLKLKSHFGLIHFIFRLEDNMANVFVHGDDNR